MSDKKYSARWKRAKRLEDKCARDQKSALEFLPANIPLKCPSLLYQLQENTGEGSSVEQNCADERDDDDLLSQSSNCCILDDSCTPAYVRAIFMRLDKIEQSLETIQSILTKGMRSDDHEIEELTRPLKTPAELGEASEKLKDTAHRKKVVDYLSLLGGATPGDSVRRMMRTIGTNVLWAKYSLKGRKGKNKFQDLAIYPVIVQACRKNHPNVLQKTIEMCVADTLKYAPHRGTQMDNTDRTSVTGESQSLLHMNAAAPEGSRSSSLLSESADSD